MENGSLLSEAATLEELEGIHPKVLVEIGPRSGSVSGAQVRLPTPS